MIKKKGFTLIEIILSIGILSILMIMFMSIMVTSTNITAKSIAGNKDSLLSQSNVESKKNISTTNVPMTFAIGGQTFSTNVEVSTSTTNKIPYTIFEYK